MTGDHEQEMIRRRRLPAVVAVAVSIVIFYSVLGLVNLIVGPAHRKYSGRDNLFIDILVTAAHVIPAFLTSRRLYPHLRWRLVIDDGPHCTRCGYSLRGLPERRCPECGQPFEAKGDAP